ncbi:hypothetical protein KDA00_02485 [Candidatus Saccharibacteria bacterium]|nr:hypothetical protein [Candidatus Saccharibacteria bacterium]
MKKEILEGEIVEEKSTISYKNDSNGRLKDVKFPSWKILISIIPVFGLVFSVIWFYYEKSKNSISIIFPIMGVVIGIFSTVTFFVLRFILKAVF